VTPLKGDEIVDTNGAGDMFAGGFMGALISGKSVEESILVGHKLGAMCVGTVSSYPHTYVNSQWVLTMNLFRLDRS
jgi:sugar/nucleoside kinase (ribokinase family)